MEVVEDGVIDRYEACCRWDADGIEGCCEFELAWDVSRRDQVYPLERMVE